MSSSSKYVNELSGSIKCGEFLGWLSDCQLFKEGSGTLN
jgi:hypothetical protein